MKQHLFIGALAVFALTACSQEEVVQLNQHGNEIAFKSVANKGSRAENYYSNANLPAHMYVWSYTADGNKIFFEGEKYTMDSESKSYTSEIARFWPEATNPLDFFAIAGTEVAPTPVNKTGMSLKYTVGEPAAQEDVLYAVVEGAVKPANGGVQPLNFRHALSQVVFKAKVNTSKKLHVVVDGVQVCNVLNSGTFAYSVSTDPNWLESTSPDNNNTTGEWTADATTASYAVACKAPVTLTGDAKELTNVTDKNALLLLPQTLENKYVPVTNKTGVCLKVKCAIYNIAGDKFDEASDVEIHGSLAQTEYITIPLAKIDWKPGKKYIYTINFGGDGSGLDEKDDPVLTPISFSVTVDDFDVVTEENVDGYVKQ